MNDISGTSIEDDGWDDEDFDDCYPCGCCKCCGCDCDDYYEGEGYRD